MFLEFEFGEPLPKPQGPTPVKPRPDLPKPKRPPGKGPRKPGFGRKPPKLPRLPMPRVPIPGGLAIPLAIIPALPFVFLPKKNDEPFQPDPSIWRFRCRHKSGRYPGNPPYGGTKNYRPYFMWYHGTICSTAAGQVPSSVRQPVADWGNGGPDDYTWVYMNDYGRDTVILADTKIDAFRARMDVNWNRIAPSPNGQTPWIVRPTTWVPLAPDALPPNPNGAPAPAPPLPLAEPVPTLDPPPQWSYGPPGAPPPAPHTSTPPRPGSKDAKVISRSQKFAIALFSFLDFLSESCEIVDAIYEAIPRDIRKLIEQDVRNDVAFLDQAGQYGIDGCDWKIPFIYEFWSEIDTPQALCNIVKNITEDQLIGVVRKNLPRNFGSQIGGDANVAISDFASQLWDELGGACS